MRVGGFGGRRGQSEVLGIVLLFALVLTVSGVVVVVGGGVINDAKSDTSTESASQSMEELQSKAAQTNSDGSVQRVSFAQAGGGSEEGSGSSVDAADGSARIEEGDSISVDDSAGDMWVTVQDSDGNSDTQPIRLGTISYEENGDEIAYQGGGVFRMSPGSDSSTIVSPPEFEYNYRSGTPTLSLGVTSLSTSSDQITRDSLALRQASSGQVYPIQSPGSGDPVMPLEGAAYVEITVQSEYYQAWGDLFDERTDVTPSYDHSNDEVTIRLEGTPTPDPDVEGALAASNPNKIFMGHKAEIVNYHSTGTASGEGANYFRSSIDLSAGSNAGMEGYDGDMIVEEYLELEVNANAHQVDIGGETIVGGDPSGTTPTTIECKGCEFGTDLPSDSDALHVGGDLELQGHSSNDAVIHGDVYVDGEVSTLRDVTIHGDLHVNGDLSADRSNVNVDTIYADSISGSGWSGDHDSTVSPTEPESPTFPSNDPVSNEIDTRGNDWSGGNNDNPGDDTIRDIKNANGCDPSCSLSSGEYHVDGTMALHSSEELKFDTTSGPIEIYVEGVEFHGGEITVEGEYPVRVYNDETLNFNDGEINTDYAANYAPGFWVYMHDDKGITIGDSGFTGVIYAPGSGGANLNINGQHNEIHGALVGKMNGNIPSHTTFNFDEALMDSMPGPVTGGSPSGDQVGYVQVTTRDVELTDE